MANFNPRSREGSDRQKFQMPHDRVISIHAPVKGATEGLLSLKTNSSLFQSTLPRRERRHPSHRLRYPPYFNPRSREGSDQARLQLRWLVPHFNPRSREGSDIGQGGISVLRRIISIHAPVKEATHPITSRACLVLLFQSTLPRRERLGHIHEYTSDAVISIHAPVKGATCGGL